VTGKRPTTESKEIPVPDAPLKLRTPEQREADAKRDAEGAARVAAAAEARSAAERKARAAKSFSDKLLGRKPGDAPKTFAERLRQRDLK
jgi:hypothetical protein